MLSGPTRLGRLHPQDETHAVPQRRQPTTDLRHSPSHKTEDLFHTFHSLLQTLHDLRNWQRRYTSLSSLPQPWKRPFQFCPKVWSSVIHTLKMYRVFRPKHGIPTVLATMKSNTAYMI
jgi:hypothetical protein